MDQVELDVERQAGRDAVRIELVRAQTLGLEENLVRSPVGETVDLVFDRRTVARTHSFDYARVQGAPIESGADDFVRAGLCMGDPARQLSRVLVGAAEEREHRHRVEVAGLFLAPREVDGAPVDAWRRAGLQPTLRQLHLAQPLGQRDRRRVAGTAGRIVGTADADRRSGRSPRSARRCATGSAGRAGSPRRPRGRHPGSGHRPPAGRARGSAGSRGACGSLAGRARGRPARGWRAPRGPCWSSGSGTGCPPRRWPLPWPRRARRLP